MVSSLATNIYAVTAVFFFLTSQSQLSFNSILHTQVSYVVAKQQIYCLSLEFSENFTSDHSGDILVRLSSMLDVCQAQNIHIQVAPRVKHVTCVYSNS